ncbi:MAG TPA: DNA double-strand break repair nuclease NurA [Candidatus Lokiarchaeia archaeon]|nr:DNA double-strand break repair nuclease NurA [Candidatus Lokiarchaeia archaeon]
MTEINDPSRSQRLERDIGNILAIVKEYYGQYAPEAEAEEIISFPDVEEFPFTVPGTPAMPFVCVDGSFTDLVHLQELDANITMFRVSTVEYNFDTEGKPVLTRHHVIDKAELVSSNVSFYKDDPVLPEVIRIAKQFEGRELDIVESMIMYLIEQKALFAAARRYSNAILARDGSLTAFFLPELKTLIDEIVTTCEAHSNILIGISKDSGTHYLDQPLVDEAALAKQYAVSSSMESPCQTIAVRIAPRSVRRLHKFIMIGDLFFAHLHPFAEKFFRVDLGTWKDDPVQAFGELAKYCTWEATPGFPFPLVEAHKSAKAIRDAKDFYLDQVIEGWRGSGIPQDVLLGGLIDKYGVAAGKFHTKIDMISKI